MKLPYGSPLRKCLRRDVQRGPVNGLADVALVVLCDEEDFISRLGSARTMSVSAATAASRSSNASTRLPLLSKIEYVMVYLRVSAGSTRLRTR